MMRRHLGKARYPALVVLAAIGIVLFARLQLVDRSRANAAMSLMLPTSSELTSALIRTGLDAETLAASGLSADNVNTVVANTYEHLIGVQPLLELADGTMADARRQTASLKRIIQSGRATDEQINAYPAASGALAQVRTERAALLAGVFEAATADLGQSHLSALAAIRANRHWDLPVEFLVVERTQAQWVELRDCLANERIAARLDDEVPDDQAQATLTELRAQPQVAIAKANCDSGLDVVTTAWEQACGM